MSEKSIDQKAETTTNYEKEGSGKLQSVLVTNKHGGYEFIINRLYFFLWCDNAIYYGLLADGIDKVDDYVKADFQIDARDKGSFIREIRTGSNPDIFIFIIQ